MRQPNLCENLNHRRGNAPVRCCPQCGGIVNARISTRQCSEESHARSRRKQHLYCVDCGQMLRGKPSQQAPSRR